METDVAVETVRFIRAVAQETGAHRLSIVFHGGEPLLAPLSLWQTLLEAYRTTLCDYEVDLNLQSNLWELTDDLLALFARHRVSIGTSLDGPEALCDLNRGKGYYQRTFNGIQRIRAIGQPVSIIATVTRQTLPHAEEIATFFRDLGTPLSLHAALRGLDTECAAYALSAEEYAQLVTGLFPWYAQNSGRLRISTLDHYCAGIVNGQPGVCVFEPCLGAYLAISPNGDICACQRLAGQPAFVMGNVFAHPTLEALLQSPAACAQREREARVAARCGACEFYDICRGGCYYHALSAGDQTVDPLCAGYKAIYAFVREMVFAEMAAPENLKALAVGPARNGEHPLLRAGRYISLAGRVHPSQIAENARRILAYYELGRTGDSAAAAGQLHRDRICGDAAQTRALLEIMQQELKARPTVRTNCYLHVTLDCNLRCNHCYAQAGERREAMPLHSLKTLLAQATQLRFEKIVLTGGEPLVHPERDALLALCRAARGKGSLLVLRTNLTGALEDSTLLAVAAAFDQVAVSVDGDEPTHDARRGQGTYRSVVANLQRYQTLALSVPGAGELSLACVLDEASLLGVPGQSVRALAEQLGIKRVRFRSLLPLGRATGLPAATFDEGANRYVSPEEKLAKPFTPLTTCGIGQSVDIRPDGQAYPCYAWCGPQTTLGNAAELGLAAVLASAAYSRLRESTVDTVRKCRECAVRYLCGGACRAWRNRNETDVNAAPVGCEPLQRQAEALVQAARHYLAD